MRDYTVKIIIATHKKYQMPKDDMYLPLHVGAEGKLDENGNDLDLGYTKDNSGDNISNLNSSFCELTGLYWAWKNIDADYIGLVHYRRHFSLKKKAGFENVLTYAELRPYLGKIRVFVPTKRWYVIETLKSHYDHTHYPEHLKITRDVLAEKSINDINVYDKVLKETLKIKAMEKVLSKILNENIVQNDENRVGKRISFISKDKYSMNIATDIATKSQSEESGDSILNIRLKDGNYLVALSDGMGSGREAKKSSSKALRMLENLLI